MVVAPSPVSLGYNLSIESLSCSDKIQDETPTTLPSFGRSLLLFNVVHAGAGRWTAG